MPAPQAGAGTDFQLVLVCTANRIRSPIAEALVQRLAGALPLSTRSRGLLDLGSKPPPRDAIEAAEDFGLDISRHRSRWLEPGSLRDCDAVVGFEPVHVAAAVLEGGAPTERVFLLRELVELLEREDAPAEDEPVERARSAVARAHERRRALRTRTLGASLDDPLGRGRSAYRSAVRELGELVPRLVDGLFPPRSSGDRGR
jgi:protein-tyrosine phosphatase